jgi:hypothetical protein
VNLERICKDESNGVILFEIGVDLSLPVPETVTGGEAFAGEDDSVFAELLSLQTC